MSLTETGLQRDCTRLRTIWVDCTVTERWCNPRHVNMKQCFCGLNIELIWNASMWIPKGNSPPSCYCCLYPARMINTPFGFLHLLMQMTLAVVTVYRLLMAVDHSLLHLLDMQLQNFSNICFSTSP